MVILTFVTGIVDAVGYLALDKVFTGNMTGNVVILGMGLAGADELPVLGPAVALAAFMIGALMAGITLRPIQSGSWTRRATLLLGVGTALLTVVTVLLVLVDTDTLVDAHVVVAGTAAAMGLQAATARHIAVPDMTTVVVTSTITSLASESFTAGSVLNRRLAAIVAIMLGAVVGALLLRLHPAAPMTLATALSAVVVGAGHLTRSR